jgi:hypothetical protein
MERADMHAAIVASVIANVNRGKGQKAFTPEDFMPRWDQSRSDVDKFASLADDRDD